MPCTRTDSDSYLHIAPEPRLVFSSTREHGAAPAVPLIRPELGPSNITVMVLPEEDMVAATRPGAAFRRVNGTVTWPMLRKDKPSR